MRELAPGVEDGGERAALAVAACHQVLSLGWRMGGGEDEAAAVFAGGRALVENSGDRAALALLLGSYGLMRYSVGGSGYDYACYGEEGARMAQALDDPGVRAAVGTFAAWGHWAAGFGLATLEWAARIVDDVGSDGLLGRDLIGFSPLASALVVRIGALTELGRLADAGHESADAERMVDRLHELEVFTWLRLCQTTLAHARGAPDVTVEEAARSLEIAEHLDNESSRMCAYATLGSAYMEAGDSVAALAAFRQSAGIIRDQRTQRAQLPLVLAWAAEAELALGDRPAAVATARKGVELGRRGGCRFFEAQAQLALGAALLATDGVVPRAEIEAALARAEQLVESIVGRSLSPRILEQRARLAAACGDTPTASRALREALDLYRAIGASGHAERLAREFGAGPAQGRDV